MLFNEHIDHSYQPLPEDRPGGFNWGEEFGMGADIRNQQQQQPEEERERQPEERERQPEERPAQ